MTDVKQCSRCEEWWLDAQAMPASTDACTHNWVLTSLDTVSPLSKQTYAQIRRRISRHRAQVRSVITGTVIVISVVAAAAALVAVTKTGVMSNCFAASAVALPSFGASTLRSGSPK